MDNGISDVVCKMRIIYITVCAAHQAVDFGNGVENIVDIEPVGIGVF